jgi:hypothetical protein
MYNLVTISNNYQNQCHYALLNLLKERGGEKDAFLEQNTFYLINIRK